MTHRSFEIHPGSWGDHLFSYWVYPQENQISHSFMTGGGFAVWSIAPTEVELLPSHRNCEAGRLKPLVFYFCPDIDKSRM